MSVKLNKFIDLVNRTGQPCVVADADSGEAIVLMSLDQYEALQCDCCCDEDVCDGDCCGKEGIPESDIEDSMENDFAAMQAHNAPYAGDVSLSEESLNAELLAQKDEEDRFYLEPVE